MDSARQKPAIWHPGLESIWQVSSMSALRGVHLRGGQNLLAQCRAPECPQGLCRKGFAVRRRLTETRFAIFAKGIALLFERLWRSPQLRARGSVTSEDARATGGGLQD